MKSASSHNSVARVASGSARAATVLLTGLGVVAALIGVACRSTPNLRIQRPEPLLRSVHFVDDRRGWIGGRLGLFYTDDGGRSWKKQAVSLTSAGRSPFDDQVPDTGAIAWADQSRVVVRSEEGIAVGDAASNSWRKVQCPRYLHAVRLSDGVNGWALGQGRAYRTSDGGETWAAVEAMPKHRGLCTLYAVSALEAWAGGEEGIVVHTTDGGRAWDRLDLGDDSHWDVLDFFFTDPQRAWLCGVTDAIYHTSDGGQTWSRQTVATGGSFRAVSFADELDGWVVGPRYNADSAILHTCDGGVRWNVQPTGTKSVLVSAQALGPGRAWVVGEDGTVLRTEDHGMHWDTVKLY